VAALLVQGWLHGPLAGGVNWLEGALTGFALLLPFYLVGGMAAGDVKLLLMIGAWVGPGITLYIALATFILGGLWSVAATVRNGQFMHLLTNLRCLADSALRAAQRNETTPPQAIKSVGSLPYGVAIAAGTIGVLFAAAA
jgi:prepilin peptidase CpaA